VSTFHPISCSVVGSLNNYTFIYSLGLDYRTASDTRRTHMRDVGHDDFLIGELSDDRRSLLDVTNSNLQPLDGWGQESYRAVADGMLLRWEPRHGTRAAEAPEADGGEGA
jgi:hypothetical protein